MKSMPLFMNIELSSRCNKNCWMCGRRKLEQSIDDGSFVPGYMELDLVKKIGEQLPPYTMVQLHNNGEPLLYPFLTQALAHFRHCIKGFNTNGKLLMGRYWDFISDLDFITISVIPNDPEAEEQYQIIKEFCDKTKGIPSPPRIIIRLLGNVDAKRYEKLGLIVRRVLHDPMGSRNYEKQVVIPETGVCLDLLKGLAIDRFGNISVCVRFDPNSKLVIGNANKDRIKDVWNGFERRNIIEKHVTGKRDEVPGCQDCDFYGVPRG